MDFLIKCHVKTDISIYCNGIFEGKKSTKKLSKSGSGNYEIFTRRCSQGKNSACVKNPLILVVQYQKGQSTFTLKNLGPSLDT